MTRQCNLDTDKTKSIIKTSCWSTSNSVTELDDLDIDDDKLSCRKGAMTMQVYWAAQLQWQIRAGESRACVHTYNDVSNASYAGKLYS